MRTTSEMIAHRKDIFLGYEGLGRNLGRARPFWRFRIGILVFVRYDTQRWRFFLSWSERALDAVLQSLTLFFI
jgi:hypothetical protein